MRVGVLMCAFRERDRIRAAIKQYQLPSIDEIVVACSKRPWFGNAKPDDTAKIALEMGVTVRERHWKTEAEQRNWAVDKLRDFDWVIIGSPDMYHVPRAVAKIVRFLKKDGVENAYGVKMRTYWKRFDMSLKPDFPFNTHVFRPRVNGKNINFTFANMIENTAVNKIIPGVRIHHISWCKTDNEVKNKLKTYSHSREIREGWYERYWLNWKQDDTDFGPCTPGDYKKVVKCKLPDSIRKTFDQSWARQFDL